MYFIKYQVRDFFCAQLPLMKLPIVLKSSDTTSYFYTVAEFVIFDKYKVYEAGPSGRAV
jgi:hypothetical protein